ncbi:MAG: hypothetical protein ACK4JB_06800 [Reyranella sp.]
MPLHWSIDSKLKLFAARADGDVTLADLNRMLDAMAGAQAHGYRKLFDGSRGDTQMGPAEFLSLGVRMRTIHATGPMGPLAVVLPANKYYLVARALGVLAAAKRPMRIFTDPDKARQWLNLPSIRAKVPDLLVGEASKIPPRSTTNTTIPTQDC